MYHENSNEKSVGVTLLIPDNIDFEAKVFTVDKEPLFVMLRVNLSRKYNNYKQICT